MKPNWSLLVLLVPLMVGLFILQDDIPLTYQGHQVVEFGIIGLTFGVLFLWVHANQALLLQEQTPSPQWESHPDAIRDPQPDTTVSVQLQVFHYK